MNRVVHAHATRHNVGDDAIVMAIHRLLAGAVGPTLRFTDVTRDPFVRPGEPIDDFLPLYQYHRPGWWYRIIRAVYRSDAVVIGGGEIVTGALEFLGLGLLGLAAGRPVLCLGVGADFQGASPLKLGYSKLVYRRARHVTRDPAAAAALVDLGVPDAQVTASWDTVLALPVPARSSASDAVVGVSLRSPQEYHPLGDPELRRIAAVLDAVVARGGRILLIPFLHPDSPYETARLERDPLATDQAVLERCRSFMRQPTAASLYQGDLSPAALIETMQGLRGLLAMRLHASILGLKAGLRPVAIAYAPKIGRTLHHIDPEVPVHTVDALDPEAVADHLVNRPPGPTREELTGLGTRIQEAVSDAVARRRARPGVLGGLMRLPLVLLALGVHSAIQLYYDLPPRRDWFRRTGKPGP